MKRGELLRKKLKEKGYTLKHVSQVARINYDTFSRYMRGRFEIPDTSLMLICEKFDIPLKFFGLCDENNSQKQSQKINQSVNNVNKAVNQ